MDEFIKQVAHNHRLAARIHLAWLVEQTVQSLGTMAYHQDAVGDGPFIQTLKAIKEESA